MKNLTILAILLLVTTLIYSCGSSMGGQNEVNKNENTGSTGTGNFLETWESSKISSYKPGASPSRIQGIEGRWYLDATVDGEPEPDGCGPTPHRAEIIEEGGSKKIKLLSNNSWSGCSDNVWLWWDTAFSGSSKLVPITPDTRIAFKESGELYGSAATSGWYSDNCGLGIPCGIYLAVLDNQGNGLFYRLQWPSDAEEAYGSTYAKILLDQKAGVYLRNLYEDFLKIPKFSPSGAYVKGINLEINPWDDNENRLGWAVFDDITISQEAQILVTLTDLTRVPIFNNDSANPNDQSVTVTVTPSPLPSGVFVTLELNLIDGTTGSATFDNGTTTMSIQQTSTVRVRGVTNSDKKDNIRLSAKLRDKELASDPFSVRTWPVNLHRFDFYPNRPLGSLTFEYRVDSESGDIHDLFTNLIGEWVDYPGDGPLYYYPSPPYRHGDLGALYNSYDPHIDWAEIGVDIFTDQNSCTDNIPCMFDEHEVPTDPPNPYAGFTKPYKDHVFIATQYYIFRDPVLMDESTYENILGPFYIRRNVYQDSEVWKYRIEKDGYNAELILP